MAFLRPLLEGPGGLSPLQELLRLRSMQRKRVVHGYGCLRAWDSAAATQPEDPATVWNPKGYVNNAQGRMTLRVVA